MRMSARKSALLSVFCFLFFFIHSAFSDEWRPLYRGARAQAMGNAFVAVADDEEALFYNPAGLSGLTKTSLYLASVNAELSNDLFRNYSDYAQVLSNPSISSANSFMGKNLSFRAQETTSFTTPGFGIGIIYDQQMALRMRNPSLPTGEIGNQATYGVQLGFGKSIVKFKRKRGEIRFGMSGKMLWRNGGYQPMNLSKIMNLDTQMFTGALNNRGSGLGLDSGLQLIYKIKKKFTLMTGFAVTDIGSTSFPGALSNIPMNATVGIAGKYTGGDMNAILSYDMAHLFEAADWGRKNHLGLELKFPLVSLYSGLNQLSFSYGLGVDLWLIKVMYVSYGEDQLTTANLDSERRTLLQFAFKFEI